MIAEAFDISDAIQTFCYSASHREDIKVPVEKKSASGVGITIFDGVVLEAAAKTIKEDEKLK